MAGNSKSGRRSRRSDGQIDVPLGVPVIKPATLSTCASKAWDVLGPLAIQIGTLTHLDVQDFTTLCETCDRLEHAREAKRHKDFQYYVDVPHHTGTTIRRENVVLEIERREAAELSKWLDRFGLSPAAPGRVKKAPKAATANTGSQTPKKSAGAAGVHDFATRARARLGLKRGA